MKKVVLGITTAIVAAVLVAMVGSAGSPTPVTATVSANTLQPGFIYTAGGNLITRNRIYTGTVTDMDDDGTDEGILIIEDSTCKLPCSLMGLEGRNHGVMIVYMSKGKVVEGRFEGRLLDGGTLEGHWQITRVAGSLSGSLTHGHGSGTYSGSITGLGSFTITLIGHIDL
ncbi:MAG: hypothetical protein QXI97_03190 [Nitrososphaerota archaeon]